jgi:hypothetical protein
MTFKLKNIQTGLFQNFRIKQILELLGDTIDDQLRIKDQVFEISSCIETDSSGTGINSFQWVKNILTVSVAGQTEFVFPHEILDTEGLFLTINGILCEYGQNADFYIANGKLIWNGVYQLEQVDKINIKYLQII